jgi:hypothetical protein
VRLHRAFSPLEIGEIDNFAFEFTADIASETIIGTSWTCQLAPGMPASADPTPQARVISSSVQTSILVRSPYDASLQTLTGFFSVAEIGNMPSSAIGSVYLLEAVMVLTDGRQLALNSSVLCVGVGS